MPFVITTDCVGCGACQATCPVEAIIEGSEVFRITKECIGCGACLGVCAVGAIIVTEEKEKDSPHL